MNKREECYKIFAENQGATREHVISLVIKKVGVTQTTAQTYYPLWRKSFIDKPGYAGPIKLSNKEKAEDLRRPKEEKTNKITEILKSYKKNLNMPECKTINEIKETDIEPTVPELNIEKIVSDAFAENKKKLFKNSEKITSEPNECATKRTEELKKEDVFIVNRLIPVVMKGKYGEYKFEKDGVIGTPSEKFISKDKVDEAMEALAIWERCYGKGVMTY